MTSINIIGTGNVAWHIATALQNANGFSLQAVAGRSENSLKDFKLLAKDTGLLNTLSPAALTIIAVADDAINKVIKNIPYTTGLFVHTSGSAPMSVLSQFENHGVFYPLQSFSKEVSVDFKEIPICIESHDKKNVAILEGLGFALSEKVKEISSKEREQLHLAAVFVNNFTNHCFTIAQDLCDEKALSFDLLRPLLETTAIKALANRPDTIQTGPAKRNDTETLKSHIKQLSNPKQQEVYKTLSAAITSYYGKKL